PGNANVAAADGELHAPAELSSIRRAKKGTHRRAVASRPRSAISDTMSDMLKRALNARVSDVLPSPTALDPAPNLSNRLRVSVFLKREDLTPIFSFKIRGPYTKI